MEITNLLEVKTREAFREWLLMNHDSETECWVVVRKGRPTEKGQLVWYIDAVEEALCFGWIDSTTKKLENGELANRFTPRKPKSSWTELNKERVRRLERMGKMMDAGRKILPDMSVDRFSIHPVILKRLEEEQLYQTFQSFPELYQRVRLDTIQSVEKNPELFQKRIEKLIENTKKENMYGDWHDYGRLLDNQ